MHGPKRRKADQSQDQDLQSQSRQNQDRSVSQVKVKQPRGFPRWRRRISSSCCISRFALLCFALLSATLTRTHSAKYLLPPFETQHSLYNALSPARPFYFSHHGRPLCIAWSSVHGPRSTLLTSADFALEHPSSGRQSVPESAS